MANLQDHIDDETREALQQIAEAQHAATDAAKKKRDRTAMMADIIRQQPQGGQQSRVQAQPKPGDPVGATPTTKGKYKNKW